VLSVIGSLNGLGPYALGHGLMITNPLAGSVPRIHTPIQPFTRLTRRPDTYKESKSGWK
jgi:hypothetical protein